LGDIAYKSAVWYEIVETIHVLLRQCFCRTLNDMVAVRIFDLIFGLVATGASYVKFVTVVNHKANYTLRINYCF
jgi:hypothetical protein